MLRLAVFCFSTTLMRHWLGLHINHMSVTEVSSPIRITVCLYTQGLITFSVTQLSVACAFEISQHMLNWNPLLFSRFSKVLWQFANNKAQIRSGTDNKIDEASHCLSVSCEVTRSCIICVVQLLFTRCGSWLTTMYVEPLQDFFQHTLSVTLWHSCHSGQSQCQENVCPSPSFWTLL